MCGLWSKVTKGACGNVCSRQAVHQSALTHKGKASASQQAQRIQAARSNQTGSSCTSPTAFLEVTPLRFKQPRATAAHVFDRPVDEVCWKPQGLRHHSSSACTSACTGACTGACKTPARVPNYTTCARAKNVPEPFQTTVDGQSLAPPHLLA